MNINQNQLSFFVNDLRPKTKKLVKGVIDKILTDIELNPLTRISTLPANEETNTVLEFLGKTIFKNKKIIQEIISYQTLTHYKCSFSKDEIEEINALLEFLNEEPYIFRHKGIQVNTRDNLIQYLDNEPVTYHKKTKSIRFIILLLSRKMVKYEEISKQLDLNQDYTERQNRLTELHKYRKSAEQELIKAKVPEDVATSIFESDRNIGFRISP